MKHIVGIRLPFSIAPTRLAQLPFVQRLAAHLGLSLLLHPSFGFPVTAGVAGVAATDDPATGLESLRCTGPSTVVLSRPTALLLPLAQAYAFF